MSDDARDESEDGATTGSLRFEEPDPEADLLFQEPDPEADLVPETPSVTVPDPTETDVSEELFETFWRLVLTLNVGLFAISLGPMLVYFRGQWRLGGGLFVLGVLAFGYAYYRYRAYTNQDGGS